MDKLIITVYDPSNNIIIPKLKRQKKFYNKINKEPKIDNYTILKEDIDIIGNNIKDTLQIPSFIYKHYYE